jgi:hypothetical protein
MQKTSPGLYSTFPVLIFLYLPFYFRTHLGFSNIIPN